MGMTVSVRWGVTLMACALASACTSDGVAGGEGGPPCTSEYVNVVGARTFAGLKDAMLASEDWGEVASLRTQARGNDVDGGAAGGGDVDAVRVMDLLDPRGRRLIQVDVWRTDGGAWRAGAWSQCID